jgi:hypothetical protein
MADNKIILIFIINGQEFPQQGVNINPPLLVSVRQVLKDSGNTGRDAEEWEVRDLNGALLDKKRSAKDLGLQNGARLFLSLQVGAGGT